MNVSLLEEKQIISILSVCRNNSFEKAANELSYTESAISKHISAAERHLGIRIFERRGRTKIFLTADGEMLLPYLEGIHDSYQRLERFIIKNTSIRESVLTLSASNLLVSVGDDEILAGFWSQHPEIKINSVIANEQRSIEMLLHGDIDVGMTMYIDSIYKNVYFAPLFNNSDFVSIPIRGPMPLTIALRESHPALSNGKVDLCALRNERFFFMARYDDPTADWKYQKFISSCRDYGFEPNTQYCHNLKNLTIFNFIAEGMGVAPVLCKPSIAYKGIVFAEVSPCPYYCNIGLYYMKTNRSRALKLLLDYIDS